MTRLLITGGTPLSGRVVVQGSKNIFLHVAAASLLCPAPVHLFNTPRITDTNVVTSILRAVGADVTLTDTTLVVHATDVTTGDIPPHLGASIRPTVCFGAALLARTGRTVFPLPGGDAFAKRRVDLHLDAMRAAGAEVRVTNGIVHASASCLRGFVFDASTTGGFGPSLGATVTALLLAATAEGTSRITTPSVEPEVEATAKLLRRMGVPVVLDGADLVVEGRDQLRSAPAVIAADRMVAGTVILAAAITDGRVELMDMGPGMFPAGFVDTISAAGVRLGEATDGMSAERGQLRTVTMETGVHPGYPTDVQPQLTALLTQAPGISRVTERVYTHRATHLPGLAAMGADVHATGQELIIRGPGRLRGATVRGDDIRAAAALVLAALAARGTTEFHGVEHLRRGYEDLPGLLRKLGADITEEEQ